MFLINNTDVYWVKKKIMAMVGTGAWICYSKQKCGLFTSNPVKEVVSNKLWIHFSKLSA